MQGHELGYIVVLYIRRRLEGCLPAEYPDMVIWEELPPKRAMLSLVHSRARRWSQNPWFPTGSLTVAASFSSSEEYRKPKTPRRYAGITMIALNAASPSRAPAEKELGVPNCRKPPSVT